MSTDSDLIPAVHCGMWHKTLHEYVQACHTLAALVKTQGFSSVVCLLVEVCYGRAHKLRASTVAEQGREADV